MRLGMEVIEQLTGERPLGWYTGRDSPNTRRLVADYGGFEYDSDYYGDDLPFWMKVQKTDGGVVPHLVVPYTLDSNDMRFSLPQGFSQAEDFFIYLRDTFDALYAEGDASPKMMSVGMHCRLLGRPGRIVALQRFLDHVQSTTGSGSAAASTSPATGNRSTLTKAEHATHTGTTQCRLAARKQRMLDGLYEHSPWIARRRWRTGRSGRCRTEARDGAHRADAGATGSWP